LEPVARANACPEIATIAIIAAVKAKFLIMVLFPCCIKVSDGAEMRIAASECEALSRTR
jgi:hypothetical protein